MSEVLINRTLISYDLRYRKQISAECYFCEGARQSLAVCANSVTSDVRGIPECNSCAV